MLEYAYIAAISSAPVFSSAGEAAAAPHLHHHSVDTPFLELLAQEQHSRFQFSMSRFLERT